MVKKLHSPPSLEDSQKRLRELGLYGLLAHWDEIKDEDWLESLLKYEEVERKKRSLERRLRNAKIGRFKAMADFDWQWPKKIDRNAIESLFRFDFIKEHANVILLGPNGVGKTTIARNLAHQALLKGYTVRCGTASEILNDLASQDGRMALARKVRLYTAPDLLLVDEVGYLSYDTRHADLLFEIISRRHQEKSMIVTTNRPFSEWTEVFPSSGCVVALIDRLVHQSELVQVEGDSYRLKESKERAGKKARKKTTTRRTKPKEKVDEAEA